MIYDLPHWVKGSILHIVKPHFTNYNLTEARYPSPIQKDLEMINYHDETTGCEYGVPTGYEDPFIIDGQFEIDLEINNNIIFNKENK